MPNPHATKISEAPGFPFQSPFTFNAQGVLTSPGLLGWFRSVQRMMERFLTIEDTHVNRIAKLATDYAPGRYRLYKVFHETDRNVFYEVQTVAGVNSWVYVSGTMTDVFANRPTDLGSNDTGFLFTASDQAAPDNAMRWSGSAWLPAGLTSAMVTGAPALTDPDRIVKVGAAAGEIKETAFSEADLVTGSPKLLTPGALALVDAAGKLKESTITDDGTTLTIPEPVQITGSVKVTGDTDIAGAFTINGQPTSMTQNAVEGDGLVHVGRIPKVTADNTLGESTLSEEDLVRGAAELQHPGRVPVVGSLGQLRESSITDDGALVTIDEPLKTKGVEVAGNLAVEGGASIRGALTVNGSPIEGTVQGDGLLDVGRVAMVTAAGTLGESSLTDDGSIVLLSKNTLSPLPAPTAASGTIFWLANIDGQATRLLLDGYDGTPGVDFRRCLGTASAPTPVTTGTILGQFSAFGCYQNGTYALRNAGIAFYAAENWSSTGRGTYISFFVTGVGATNLPEAMRLTRATGGAVQLGVGLTNPSHAVDVVGDINTSTAFLVAGVTLALANLRGTPAVSATNSTAVIGATALQVGGAMAPAGAYLLRVFLATGSVTGIGTATLTIAYNDGNRVNTITLPLTMNGIAALTPAYLIKSGGAADITYAMAVSGTGNYDLEIRMSNE